MDSVQHWMTTAFDGLVGFLPNLLAGLLILAVGYLVAVVLRRITQPLLHRLGFDRLVQRLGISDPSDTQMGSRTAASAVFVVALLATFMQAARAFNLMFVATGLATILAYLPHVLGAAVIFGAALFFGNFVRDRMLRESTDPRESVVAPAEPRVFAGGQRRIVAASVRAGILALGAFMALRELQIAPEIVTIGFALVLGAIAVATALAFGLGSREVAGNVARDWYERRPRLDAGVKPVWNGDERRVAHAGAFRR